MQPPAIKVSHYTMDATPLECMKRFECAARYYCDLFYWICVACSDHCFHYNRDDPICRDECKGKAQQLYLLL